eukprot:2484669-Rhodomonas_salina.1
MRAQLATHGAHGGGGGASGDGGGGAAGGGHGEGAGEREEGEEEKEGAAGLMRRGSARIAVLSAGLEAARR